MKKNILALIFSALLVAFFAAPVLATNCGTTFGECDTITDTNGGGAGITGLEFSPNVTFAYAGTDEAYSMGTYNTAGTKTYGASSDYSGLYVTSADVTSAQAIPAASGTWASTTWSQVAK